MKRIGIQLFCALLCMTLLAACGQTPVSSDSSLPQDVSTTTSTLDDTTATTDEGADVTNESADTTDTTTQSDATATTDEGADVTDESADTTDTTTQGDATTTTANTPKVTTTTTATTTQVMQPAGLNIAVKGVPLVDDFSSMEYEPFECHFRKVESAVLYKDGETESIAPEDPRLIRLLNFIMHSHNNGHNVYRTGLVQESESSAIFQTGGPLLEICFLKSSAENTGTKIMSYQKIWVFEDFYLGFLDPEDPRYYWATKNEAEQDWPYKDLLWKEMGQDFIANEEQEDIVWLDLLTYAGFT